MYCWYMYICTAVYTTTNFKSDKQVDKSDQPTHIHTHTDTQHTYTNVRAHYMYLYPCKEYIHSKQQFATHSGQDLRYHSQNNSSNLAYLNLRVDFVISKILAELASIYHFHTPDIE